MFLSALLLLLVLLLLPLLLWFALRRPSASTSFWCKRGIPGPEPASLLKGNIDSIFGETPAVLQLQQWTKQFGPVYGIQEGWYQQLVISDPAMVRELLVDKFEYFHGRMVGKGKGECQGICAPLKITPLIGDVDKTKLVHLFAAKGKRWKRLRTIATPAFSVTNLKRVMPTIDHSIRVTMALLDEACAQGGPVNLHT
jgi:cytochrome P450